MEVMQQYQNAAIGEHLKGQPGMHSGSKDIVDEAAGVELLTLSDIQDGQQKASDHVRKK